MSFSAFPTHYDEIWSGERLGLNLINMKMSSEMRAFLIFKDLEGF